MTHFKKGDLVRGSNKVNSSVHSKWLENLAIITKVTDDGYILHWTHIKNNKSHRHVTWRAHELELVSRKNK